MSVRILTAEERRQGLGATDVAAWVGVDRYKTPIDVYLEKTGQVEPQERTWRMRLGQIFEDAIADAYAESEARRIARCGVVFHPRYPYLYAHPDRKVIGEPGLVECKKTAGSAELSPSWHVQAQWQMACTGRLWVDVVVFDGRDAEPIRVARDQELITSLEEAAVEAWTEHIVPGIPPEVDATEAYRRYLADRHRVLVEERVATAEQVLLLDELKAATEALAAADRHKTLVENRLIDGLAGAERLLAPQATVTYKAPAPSVSWKAVAERIAAKHDEDLEALKAENTAGKEAKPRIHVSWKKEEE